jgi:choline dehydrogenase-like flavoprotein
MSLTGDELPIAVIGAGAGGLPAATALVEAGHRVVLIERGSEVKSESFPTHRFDYEVQTVPWSYTSKEWRGEIDVQRGIGIGGSTLYFQAVSYLPPDNVISNWGLPSSRIRQLESDLTKFLQIAGKHQPYHPLNTVSQTIYTRTKKSGWKINQAPVAILSRPHDGRPACNQCGLCIYGCRPGDKSSADRTWLPRAQRTGNLTINVNTQVESLQLGSKRKVNAVNVRYDNKLNQIRVKGVVLAAGALETPYLLKTSRQSLAPEGLGNDSVGRYLSASLWKSVLVTLDVKNANGYAGIPVDLLVDEFVSQGVLMCQGRNLVGITGPVSTARLYNTYLGKTSARSWLRENYSKLAGLGAYAESVGTRDHQIDILQKRIIKPISTADEKLLNAMRERLLDWADVCNADVILELESGHSPHSGAMLRGTCRIGNSAENSAVAPDGRLRGYDNIVISDASVLGPGVIAHPSLLLQVLGYYFGQCFATQLKAA